MKRWYLIRTKPRKETVAEENLRRQGWEIYLPRIQQRRRRRRGRWSEIIEPLFPCYLFIHLHFGFDNISPIHYTTGVHKFVRFSEQPAVVPDEIIESLRRTEDCNKGLRYPNNFPFKPGDKVLIDTGPLTGLQAIFLAEKGQDRVVILFDMLGRENRATVELDVLRSA